MGIRSFIPSKHNLRTTLAGSKSPPKGEQRMPLKKKKGRSMNSKHSKKATNIMQAELREMALRNMQTHAVRHGVPKERPVRKENLTNNMSLDSMQADSIASNDLPSRALLSELRQGNKVLKKSKHN